MTALGVRLLARYMRGDVSREQLEAAVSKGWLTVEDIEVAGGSDGS